MPEQLQLSLPYQEIKETVGRNYLRENFTVSSRVAYKIPFEKLQIREGFNKRMVYDKMDELCESIKTKGLLEPLTVDILTDGTIYIERGHRRYKALQMLIEQGEVIDYVECYPNPKTVTEFDRMENIYTSNMYSDRLKPLEQANVARSLKYDFGEELTNEAIAARLGISRQKVDYLIEIAQAPDDIKNQIFMENMGMTEAVACVRAKRKNKKQAEKAELEANKNTAGKTPLPVDINAKELQELKDLEGQQPEDDLPFIYSDTELEVLEDGGVGVRMSTYDPETKHQSEPLDLVGNTVAKEKSAKKEDNGTVDYDESRPEVAQVQNCIKLADRIEARFNKIDCIDDGTKKDIADWVKWMQKDLAEIRTWIHKNKKQNKIR